MANPDWTDPHTWGDGFNVGDMVLWPNGCEGRIVAIDPSDDTLLDECGGWHSAFDVDRLAA